MYPKPKDALTGEGVGIYFVYNCDSTVHLAGKLEQTILEYICPGGKPPVGKEIPAMDPKEMTHHIGYYIDMNDFSETNIGKVQAVFPPFQGS